ncbi:MAG: ABC transporter substrate-binding protein [Pseudomonadota bacterium]|nr:ABC transporter substrate-binding protein [Pseudomonadota bacterium]
MTSQRSHYRLRVFQVSHNINMLDQYLAQAFGFYAAAGLEVEPVIGFDFSGYRLTDPVALLQQGDIDFAIAGSLLFAPAAQRGLEIRHLLVTRIDPPHWFLARPGITHPHDLKGKRLGIRPGMALFYYLVRGWLRDNGLDPDRDVEFLDPELRGTQGLNLSESLWAWQIFAATADLVLADEVRKELYLALGYRPMIDAYGHYSGSTHGIVTTADFVEHHPDICGRLVEAHVETTRFIANEPQRVIAWIAEHWHLAPQIATRVYQAMAAVFVHRADASLIRNEIRLFNSVPELPDLPETLAQEWFEPKFAARLL